MKHKDIELFISPCPNDTFIFDAIINERIDTLGIKFHPTFLDIDQLNKTAILNTKNTNDTPSIIKISAGVLDKISTAHTILTTGGAMGYGNGPLLVSRHKIYSDELHDVKILIPGIDTTANRMMDRLFPEAQNKEPMLFSQIAEAVMDSQADAGVLIHEGRFTYQNIGLKLISDLGERWQEKVNCPIPLGVIAATKNIDSAQTLLINNLIRQSIQYAITNPSHSHEFTRSHAQELSPEVLSKHISFFVNDFSLNMSNLGKQAIKELIGEHSYSNLVFFE